VALGGTQTRNSLHGTRSRIGCVCQFRAAAIARKAGGSLNQKTRQPLVWLFVMARWLSSRVTSRLDQPGHPGRRTDRMLDRTSTRRGSLKTQQTRCLRIDGARDWTPQLVSLAQFATKCTDFDAAVGAAPAHNPGEPVNRHPWQRSYNDLLRSCKALGEN